jgi:serine/threonine-protein kinase
MLEVGQVIDGKYKVLAKVGQGGMSTVYLALNERANKQWAVKEIRKEGMDNFEVIRQSLMAETDILKSLSHPFLPSIVDVVDASDMFLIVMDYIEGLPLSDTLGDTGAQDQEDVVSWAKQLCDVFDYLHNQTPPIVYRDLKPGNIMLRPNGTVCMIDFGTARKFKPGRADDTVALGTRGYAAPEQYGQHQTDARTDVYTLGATMYHLLTGHDPSSPPYEMAPIRSHDPRLSSGLEAIVAKCTQADPNERYQTAAELLADLEHYRDLDYENLRRRRRLIRTFVGLAAAGALCLAAAGAATVAMGVVAEDAYDSLVERVADTYESNPEDAIGDIKRAVQLAPERPQAYRQLLDSAYANHNISTAEDETIRAVFNGDSGTLGTNIAALGTADSEAYEALAYDLGLAYFFFYDDGQADIAAQQKASSYLKAASASTTLEEGKRAMAANLLAIAGNSGQVFEESGGKSGLAASLGGEEFTGADFWSTLNGLVADAGTAGNDFVDLHIYRYVVNTIAAHCADFYGYGIPLADQEALLQTIQQGLGTMLISDSEDAALQQQTQRSAEAALLLVQTAAANQGVANGTSGDASDSAAAAASAVLPVPTGGDAQ